MIVDFVVLLGRGERRGFRSAGRGGRFQHEPRDCSIIWHQMGMQQASLGRKAQHPLIETVTRVCYHVVPRGGGVKIWEGCPLCRDAGLFS